MKKIICLISALLLSLSLCGCAKKGFNKNELLESDYAARPLSQELSLRLKNDSFNPHAAFADLIVENKGGREFTFDAVRRLEVSLGGSWYIVPDESPAVNLALYYLDKGETAELKLQLEGHYSSLPSGHYRIIKLFTDQRGENELTAVEFNID